MFPLTLTTIALVILLYGAAWHDEPARPTVIERRTRPTPKRPLVRQVRLLRRVMRKRYGSPRYTVAGLAKHEGDMISSDHTVITKTIKNHKEYENNGISKVVRVESVPTSR